MMLMLEDIALAIEEVLESSEEATYADAAAGVMRAIRRREPDAWRWTDDNHRGWSYRLGYPADISDRPGFVLEELFLIPDPDDG